MQPLNQRIKSFILDKIDSGEWSVGQKIPSEPELVGLFKASRMTVNRAVKELAEIGRLERVQGLGTYVAKFVATAPLFEIQSIKQDIEGRSEAYSCRVLRFERIVLSEQDTVKTGIEPGEHYFLEALHMSDGNVLQLERRTVNSVIAPAFISQDITKTTASEYLLRHVPYTDVNHTVHAVAADENVANYLNLKVGAPCLRLTRQTLSHDQVITHVELIHPGNKFSLSGSFAGTFARSQVA